MREASDKDSRLPVWRTDLRDLSQHILQSFEREHTYHCKSNLTAWHNFRKFCNWLILKQTCVAFDRGTPYWFWVVRSKVKFKLSVWTLYHFPTVKLTFLTYNIGTSHMCCIWPEDDSYSFCVKRSKVKAKLRKFEFVAPGACLFRTNLTNLAIALILS